MKITGITDCVLGHNEVLFRRPQQKAPVSIHYQEVGKAAGAEWKSTSEEVQKTLSRSYVIDEPLQMELNCVTTTGKGREMTSSTDILASSLVHKEDFYAAILLKHSRDTRCAFCFNELPVDWI
ncbi:hypothetical protein OROHE_014935 [Orobanche hederae]